MKFLISGWIFGWSFVSDFCHCYAAGYFLIIEAETSRRRAGVPLNCTLLFGFIVSQTSNNPRKRSNNAFFFLYNQLNFIYVPHYASFSFFRLKFLTVYCVSINIC